MDVEEAVLVAEVVMVLVMAEEILLVEEAVMVVAEVLMVVTMVHMGGGLGNDIGHWMWNVPDPAPRIKPVFCPQHTVGPRLPTDLTGRRKVDFFKLFFIAAAEIVRRFCYIYKCIRSPAYPSSSLLWWSEW